MIWIQKVLFVLMLLILNSSVCLAQTDMSGKWEAHLQILPEYGSGTFDSIWDIKQSGKKVTGSITEVGSGKVTEFTDGYHGKAGSLSFTIKSQYQGQPAVIEVSVKVNGDSFEGTYEIAVDIDQAVTTLVFAGKLTGRKVGDSTPPKNTDKKGEKNATKRNAETKTLFDGTSLENFHGYKKESIGKGWNIENGLLHFNGKKSGDIITKEQYGSFELTFDWKVSKGGDSGVLYRVTSGDSSPLRSGIEYQILDNDNHKDGKNREKSAGAIYALFQPGSALPNAAGKWNSSKIVTDGDKVEHWLNGKKVVAVEIGGEQWQEKVADTKFAKWKKFGKSKRGHIAFQDRGDQVWYRNIEIKVLN